VRDQQVSDEVAWTWLSLNPAKALGIADRTGSLRPARWRTWCCGTAIR
jgi:imidazolonepropionase-like amidohydrolase